MTESTKIFVLTIIIMGTVVLLTLSGSTFLLYQTAINEQKERLYEMVKNQSMFIHVFHKATSSHGDDMELTTHLNHTNELEEVFEALSEVTAKQYLEKHTQPALIFFIAEKKDDLAFFHIGTPQLINKPVPLSKLSNHPMGQALNGKSGVLKTEDHMGNDILCSYTFVESFGVGIVAKVMIQDIRRPFLKTGLLSFFGSLLLILLSGFIMKYTVSPLTQRLEQKRKEVEEINKNLHHLATTDTLTGLYNRTYFNEQLKHAIDAANHHSRDVAIILFDIDNFKLINDTYGHPKGDDILKETSNLIRNRIRKTDILARWGGEEFIILTPEYPPHTGRNLAKKLCEIISQHTFTIDQSVTCSFGVTTFIRNETIDNLIKRADDALYTAENKGRNTIVVQ